MRMGHAGVQMRWGYNQRVGRNGFVLGKDGLYARAIGRINDSLIETGIDGKIEIK